MYLPSCSQQNPKISTKAPFVSVFIFLFVLELFLSLNLSLSYQSLWHSQNANIELSAYHQAKHQIHISALIDQAYSVYDRIKTQLTANQQFKRIDLTQQQANLKLLWAALFIQIDGWLMDQYQHELQARLKVFFEYRGIKKQALLAYTISPRSPPIDLIE
jgi:hypothetical protein